MECGLPLAHATKLDIYYVSRNDLGAITNIPYSVLYTMVRKLSKQKVHATTYVCLGG